VKSSAKWTHTVYNNTISLLICYRGVNNDHSWIRLTLRIVASLVDAYSIIFTRTKILNFISYLSSYRITFVYVHEIVDSYFLPGVIPIQP